MKPTATWLLRSLLLALLLLLPVQSAFAERPDISSDRQTFDLLTGRYLLDGHVRVQMKERVITAGHAQVSLVTQEVWAQDDVTLMQDDIYFRGDTLYVEGRENRAALTGHTRFERGDLTIEADAAVFNWRTKRAECTGHVARTRAGETAKCSRLVYDVTTGEIVSEE